MHIPNKLLVQQLSQKQDNLCVFCKMPMQYHNGEAHLHPQAMTKEHIVPKAHGGSDDESNYVVSCNRCNSLRGTISFELFELIVQQLFTEESLKKHWHSKSTFVVERLRKVVGLEVMRRYAYVNRRTDFEFLEIIQKQKPLR